MIWNEFTPVHLVPSAVTTYISGEELFGPKWTHLHLPRGRGDWNVEGGCTRAPPGFLPSGSSAVRTATPSRNNTLKKLWRQIDWKLCCHLALLGFEKLRRHRRAQCWHDSRDFERCRVSQTSFRAAGAHEQSHSHPAGALLKFGNFPMLCMWTKGF